MFVLSQEKKKHCANPGPKYQAKPQEQGTQLYLIHILGNSTNAAKSACSRLQKYLGKTMALLTFGSIS